MDIIERTRPKPNFIQAMATHLVPLIGIFLLNWDTWLLLLTYFIETIIIVLFHVLRLYIVHKLNPAPNTAGAESTVFSDGQSISPGALPLFSLVLYGLFCGVQMLLLGSFVQTREQKPMLESLIHGIQGPLMWPLMVFTAVQVQVILVEYFSGRYENTKAEEFFFRPFRRILTQQLVVILGSFLVIFGGHKAYTFLLVAINFAIDLLFFYLTPKAVNKMVKLSPEAQKNLEELDKMMKP
jgi:hypothetical protein